MKLAWKSCSFSWSKVSIASCWRPNALTMLCPVCISSTCPLSLPVCIHWAANCCDERLATNTVTAIDRGTVSSEMTASSGLIQNMIAMTPMIVHSAVISWVSVCWSEFAMLSMSLVTRLSVSPRGWLSKYFRGSRDSLASTSRRIR